VTPRKNLSDIKRHHIQLRSDQSESCFWCTDRMLKFSH